VERRPALILTIVVMAGIVLTVAVLRLGPDEAPEGDAQSTGQETAPAELEEVSQEPTEQGPTSNVEVSTLDVGHWTFDLPGLDLAQAALDDELGRLVQTLDDGRRVVFTIDPGLQERMTRVVARYDEPAEAVVAIEPSTGRVLAWVEATNEHAPADNPASSAVPWAASIFKIVAAAQLIQDDHVDPHRTRCVPRSLRSIELEDLRADPRRDHLCVDMIDAMARSVNVFFARLVVRHTSQRELQDWVERFGFNAEIPFELPVEPSAADVPEDELERARMAAGFRYAHLSPLHGALIAAAVGNGGRMMAPTLVLEVRDENGEVIWSHEPTVWRQVMTETTATTLTLVMSRTAETGTARRHFLERAGWPSGYFVAGKTGTISNRTEEEPNPDPLLTYSWFVGFAPIATPTIAVSALVVSTPTWYIKGAYLASETVVFHHLHAQP
jgi:cell division protein FtsI/penicillin-binding protein 2